MDGGDSSSSESDFEDERHWFVRRQDFLAVYESN